MGSNTTDLDRPIIFVGTHRSGTTWMGDEFSRHPDLAYFVEPRHVWSWSHNALPDDRLTAEHATPRVREHIRNAFAKHVRSQGKSRLVEKTPSNCLRLPFVRAIYPDAKIVLVVRDGRSVIASTEDIQHQGVQTKLIFRRALQTPLPEWPAQAGRLASALHNKLTRKPMKFWGPRPPGWREWTRVDEPDVIRAKQWAATVLCAYRDAHAMGDVMIFRFEDMMQHPADTMRQIADFCELAGAEDIIEHVAATADPSRNAKRRAEKSNLDNVRSILEPALVELGYTWDSAS